PSHPFLSPSLLSYPQGVGKEVDGPGSGSGFDCVQLSHPPTHWQIFFTRPTLRLLRNRFPETCHLPGRGPSNSRYLSLREWPRLPSTARIGQALFHRARSASKEGT